MDIAVDHLEIQASQPETVVVAEAVNNSNNSALQRIETRQRAQQDWLQNSPRSDISDFNFNSDHLTNEVNLKNSPLSKLIILNLTLLI